MVQTIGPNRFKTARLVVRVCAYATIARQTNKIGHIARVFMQWVNTTIRRRNISFAGLRCRRGLLLSSSSSLEERGPALASRAEITFVIIRIVAALVLIGVFELLGDVRVLGLVNGHGVVVLLVLEGVTMVGSTGAARAATAAGIVAVGAFSFVGDVVHVLLLEGALVLVVAVAVAVVTAVVSAAVGTSLAVFGTSVITTITIITIFTASSTVTLGRAAARATMLVGLTALVFGRSLLRGLAALELFKSAIANVGRIKLHESRFHSRGVGVELLVSLGVLLLISSRECEEDGLGQLVCGRACQARA